MVDDVMAEDDGLARSAFTPELPPGRAWAVQVVDVGDGAFATVFSAGVQHFTIAEGDGDDGRHHCWLIGQMFEGALRVVVDSTPDYWPAECDLPLPDDAQIKAAFPTRSGRHDIYAEAMRLVGARRSKGGLVALVNWLLHRIASAADDGGGEHGNR